MTHKPAILLVEGTEELAQLYGEHLTAENYMVVKEMTGQGALARLDKGIPAAMILDLMLPDIGGLQVLDHASQLYPSLPVIVIAANSSVDVAVEAMQHGAYDFIVKPFPAARLTITLRNALECKALASEVAEWRQAVGQDRYYSLIGQSPLMQAMYRVIDAVAPSKASVFLTGENGTGKEMAARAIHNASPRRDKPFMAINCAAIPADLMESTIFGHMKGAFTGAVGDHMGSAKAAHGGTLFLDEICDMPLEMQTKLLRFTQTGEIMPLGSVRVEFADVRIISATNRDPIEEIAMRRFREDLYYRLHVVSIEVPALRDRGDDIIMLASHFLARFNAEEDKNFTGLSPEVMSLFRRYEWPGNVRQLENVIRNVVVLQDGATVTEAMLPKDLKRFAEESVISAANQNVTDDLTLVDRGPEDTPMPLWVVEKQAIMDALAFTGQDITRAATILEVSPSTLYRKLNGWRDSEGEIKVSGL